MLKRRKESNTYLTQPSEKMKYKKLVANTVAFISNTYTQSILQLMKATVLAESSI